MKKVILQIIFLCITTGLFAQNTTSTLERQLTDTICNCLARTDIDKITDKNTAIDVFTACFAQRTDLLMKLAREKGIDVANKESMRQIGTDIGKDLLAQNCVAFSKISVKMVQGEREKENKGDNTGIFKRIDVKGFNYIVISEGGNEKSFIWLKQFPGSEKFINNTVALAGKKIKISWEEIEVYIPQAKGYYKIKEITSIEFI